MFYRLAAYETQHDYLPKHRAPNALPRPLPALERAYLYGGNLGHINRHERRQRAAYGRSAAGQFEALKRVTAHKKFLAEMSPENEAAASEARGVGLILKTYRKITRALFGARKDNRK